MASASFDARHLERLGALGGERLGGGPGVLQRAGLRSRALELLLRRGRRRLLRLELGRDLRRPRVGGLPLGERRLSLGLGLLGPGEHLRGGPLGGGAGRGADLAHLLARLGALALDRRARLVAGRLDRGIGALRDVLALAAGSLALRLGLRRLFARGAQLGRRALGALLGLRAHLAERALAVALRALDLGARGGDLALALGDGVLKLRARRALRRVALVEIAARGLDLLTREAGLLLGRGPCLLVKRDALGQLVRLAVAAAQGLLGLCAQAGELVARLARSLLGGAAQPPLGLEALLERGHRLAALLGGTLGGLAAAALLAQRVGDARRWRGRRDRGRRGRRGRRQRGRGRRRRGGRGPLGACRGLLGPGQVDDAAARLQREHEVPVGQQRGGRRERRAPRQRIGAGERRRVVGPWQRGEAARAAAVVEQQQRRRQALARVRPPAADDPQQNGAATGGHALEALNLEFGGATAQRREESRSASAIFARLRTFSGVSSASSTRNRCGSAAASSS